MVSFVNESFYNINKKTNMKKILFSAMVMAMMCMTTTVSAQSNESNQSKKECCQKKAKACCEKETKACCKKEVKTGDEKKEDKGLLFLLHKKKIGIFL